MLKVLCLVGAIGVALAPPLVAQADRPLADWGVYTVVTSGSTSYEGEKTRAILSYGETGGPRLVIEMIHVEMAYPSPNKVVWRANVDVSGGMAEGDVCPIAESWCGTIVDLRWDGEVLRHTIATPTVRFGCSTAGVARRELITSCTRR